MQPVARIRTVLIVLFIIAFCCLAFCTAPADEEEAEYAAEDSGYQESGGTDTPPSVTFNPAGPEPVRLIFIHHSTGENWLTDDNGDLGKALMKANYYVSDTNYGWGPA